MITEAIEKIRAMALDAAARQVELDGRPYLLAGEKLTPIYEPEERAIFFTGLESMVDFVKATGYSGLLVVDNPAHVTFFSDVHGKFKQRNGYAETASGFQPFTFSRYLPIEEFIIALMTQFEETDGSEYLLKMVSNMEFVASKTYEDSGTDQTVIAKTGPVTKGKTKIKNPIRLKPFRTFLEIGQPESLFVVRVRGGEGDPMQVGLWDAGNMWRMEADRSIKAYLNEAFHDGQWENVHIL